MAVEKRIAPAKMWKPGMEVVVEHEGKFKLGVVAQLFDIENAPLFHSKTPAISKEKRPKHGLKIPVLVSGSEKQGSKIFEFRPHKVHGTHMPHEAGGRLF